MSMDDFRLSTTETVRVTPSQVRAARALLDWSRPEAAARCRINASTFKRLETGAMPSAKTMTEIIRTFNDHGVHFVDVNGNEGVFLIRVAHPLPVAS